eukprot:CAMPEP_0172929020 /NCGR_PEP_ID=MMETSP1075-20121228/218271_1 /TAXON_ID=2916 /ORGANISM="Ceratium fusus, Strain PA161109" /LENGTH=252 /DNA_ID=CAMNT_0013790309 /DNA_START=63 /DNA_END=822 /DNA_ORIENTATION=-
MPKYPMYHKAAANLRHFPLTAPLQQHQDVPPLAWMGILTEDAIRNLAQQDVPTVLRMGILTQDEIRNLALHIEHCRSEDQAMESDLMQVQAAVHEVTHARRQNQEAILALHIEHCRSEDQAMESDLMQVQAAVHEVTHARRQNQEAMYKIATDTGRLLQLLSRPEVQQQNALSILRGSFPAANLFTEAAENMENPWLNVLNNETPGAEEAMDLKDSQTLVQAQQTNAKPVDPQVMSQTSRRRRKVSPKVRQF